MILRAPLSVAHVKDVGLEFMATNKVLNFYLMADHKSTLALPDQAL